MMVSAAKLLWRPCLLAAFALPALAVLTACGANRPSFFGGDIKVTATIDAEANQNNPIKVEVLVVKDKALLEELLKLPAAKWFAQREQYKKDHPGDKDFVSRYWEWVPGQEIPAPQEISFGTGARGGLVFAEYLTGQEGRVRFDPHQDVLHIHLQEEGFTVDPRL